MPVAELPSDAEAIADGFIGPACQRRREVLRETLDAFRNCQPPTHFHHLAARNLARWRQNQSVTPRSLQVLVVPDDWGEVARRLTTSHGACVAVLNMCNAYFPGGAYGEGASAQEENMFRRTACHFQVHETELNADGRTYTPAVSHLVQGVDGRVYLDSTHPRVCIRGPELRRRDDLGYQWLKEDEVFPFFELRAAAQDLRDGSLFDPSVALRTITAIFDTLASARVRHVVLGALGCGAFENPTAEVAHLFHRALHARAHDFDVVAFAIYQSGYGPDNYTPFAEAFGID